MNPPRKIGLFGGTFDPVHLGHVHLATVAKDALELDQVRFLPCRISPHKAGTSPASGEHRCEMLRLATRDLPWAVVDDFELHQREPSYSYETAEAMAVVSSPSRRLRLWLELRGSPGEVHGTIENALMDLFSQVGAVTQQAEAVIRKREDAKSVLVRAMLEAETAEQVAVIGQPPMMEQVAANIQKRPAVFHDAD